MATSNIGELAVKLSADAAAFVKGMEKAKRSTDDFATKAKKAGLAAAKGFAVVGTAVTAAAVGIAAAAAKAISNLDKIGKTADRLGLSTDALQELQHAAGLSGVSVETFNIAVQRMGRRAGDAFKGNKQLAQAFKDLGVEVKNADGSMRDVESVFTDVIDGLGKMKDEATRNAAAMKIFDSEGVALVNMAKNGAAGLQQMRDEAKQLGLVLDEHLIREAESANDALGNMEAIVSAQWTQLLASLSPIIIDIGNAFANAAPQIADFVETWLMWRNMDEKSLYSLKSELKDVGEELQQVRDKMANVNNEHGRNRGNTLQLKRQEVALLFKQAELEDTINQKQADQKAAWEARKKAAKEAAAEMKKVYEQQRKEREAEQTAETDRKKAAKAAEDEKKAMDELARRYKDMVDPLQKYRDQLNEVEKLHEKGKLTDQERLELLFQINEQMDQTGETQKKVAKDAVDFGHEITSAFEDAIRNGKDFGEVLKGLAEDIFMLVLRAQVTNPIANAINGFTSGLDFGGFFNDIGSMFGLGRAGGGRTYPGSVYPVGERGPELFVPDGPGTIMPNYMVGGGSAAGPITIQIKNEGTPQEVKSTQGTMTAEGLVLSIITQDIARGGKAAGALERTYGLRRR